MSDVVIVSIVSFLGTLAGSFGGMQLVKYRIDQLEKRVEKHNNFAERIPVVEEKIEALDHRVDAIEKKIG